MQLFGNKKSVRCLQCTQLTCVGHSYNQQHLDEIGRNLLCTICKR